MLGYYNYTVILTYTGMLVGFVGIVHTWDGDLKMSLICLMISGLCDMFDGRIAATMERTRQEKRFGIQIDSLSDLICFGLLPALIVFRCSGGALFHILIPGAYVLCALIRLAWFNVDEEQRQDREEGGREAYLGLPVTTVAVLLPLLMVSTQLLKLPLDKVWPWPLALLALAFISPFSLKKPKLKGKLMVTLCGAATLALVLIGGRI